MAVYLGSNKVAFKGGTFNTDGTSINNQNKTVTPTTSTQTVTADSGYTGLGTVTVNRIPTSYIVPSGNKEITANGTGIDVTAYATVSVAVPTGGGSTPDPMTLPTSTSSSATSGYTSKATISRSTSTQYLNIPPGYLSAGAYYTISATPNGSATAPSSISGTSATVTTGTNTLTLTKTVSVTPSVSAGYVSAGTAGNSSVSLTASITTKAAATITPGTTNQTIASGTYLTGTQTISGDSNLVAGNIKSGVSIFGVAGSYTGSGGGTSMNVQVAQSTSRATSTSYTSLVSLTCTKAGTYNVYWTGFRSSTSGTWGSQLYLGGSAYGSAQSTFSNHIQNVALTGVQISANQTVAVYARSRGSNYYAYVSNLIIEQTA